mgnify:CR=1 FL=1
MKDKIEIINICINVETLTNMSTIYRFKFTSIIGVAIEQFSSVHKFDDAYEFREAWDAWTRENECIIEREKTYLNSLGWKGDLGDKMYKSARYYFKNKSIKQRDAKKRRQYATIDKKFLVDMDKHINEVAFVENMKPAHAYNNFTSRQDYSGKMDEQIEHFQNSDWKEVDILNKIKKTYKNRYYRQQKNSLN